MAQPSYKLSHFNSRVLAEPIQLLFAAAGIDYTDNRVSNWEDVKPNTPWGNLPILEEDGKILAQSGSILRYLGKKYKLMGSNDFEVAKCDEIIEVFVDLRIAYFTVILEADVGKKKDLETKLLDETFPFHFKRLNESIEENGSGYLVGTNLSVADLTAASYLQIFSDAHPGILDKYPALKRHQDTVFNSDGIKEWVEKRP